MRVFIELPTWLGDAVMSSSAIDLLLDSLGKTDNIKVVFFGSAVAVALYEGLECCERAIIDDSKKAGGFRAIKLRRIAKELGKFDLALSFRASFASKLMLWFLCAKFKFSFNKHTPGHQVQKYENLAKSVLASMGVNETSHESRLRLGFKPFKFSRASIGINPGASYGSAKRWDSESFAEVAAAFGGEFDVYIFGGKAEESVCASIEQDLLTRGIAAKNLAGKTSIKELCELIGGLSLFITNDSGPMHIAAAYAVPTVAVFGSTKVDETSPYAPAVFSIARLEPPLECMPCMRRVCPLKTNACLKGVSANMVVRLAKNLLSKRAG